MKKKSLSLLKMNLINKIERILLIFFSKWLKLNKKLLKQIKDCEKRKILLQKLLLQN